MAEATKNAPQAATGRKKAVRLSREQRNLPILSPAQKYAVQLMLQGEKACRALREHADSGKPVPKEAIAAVADMIRAVGFTVDHNPA